jgi:VWFA-related protein
MTRLLISLVLVAATGHVAAERQAPAERPPGRLLIDAVAVDKDGAPVSDLRKDEVEVWIAGYRVPIETFAVVTPATDPSAGRQIVLLLDDVTLPLVAVPRVREVARRFVNAMSPGDRMSIVTLNRSLIESTDYRAQLLQRIDSYNGQMSGFHMIDRIGEHVLTTIASLAHRLAEAPERRKTIVAIGSSWLFDAPIPPPSLGRDARPQWLDAMRTMALANVTLYVIDPGGVGAAPTFGGSSGFSRETGGQTFANTNDLSAAADRIMREAATYYLIGVADPPVQRQADLRELDVRSLRRGVSIRARRAVPGKR